jgi:hypothetical protein
MVELQMPATEPVAVDGETSAALDKGIKHADAGRTASLDEARQSIESRKPR